MEVYVHLEPSSPRALSLRVRSILGQAVRANVEISSAEPLDGAALVGTPARVEVTGDEGCVALYHGVIAFISAVATADPGAQRLYALDIRSSIEWLTLRKSARIFRKKTAVAIVMEILAGVGIEGEMVVNEVGEEPPEREHVSQWNETDAAFLRRICEEEGLFFRFDPKDGFDAFALCDRSSDAPETLPEPLPFVDTSGLRTSQRVAFNPRFTRQRRAGKVTVRDYDPARPALPLEGFAEGGLGLEKSVEVYEAPARFRSESEGQRAARIRLEALRADAATLRFETTALALRPGRRSRRIRASRSATCPKGNTSWWRPRSNGGPGSTRGVSRSRRSRSPSPTDCRVSRRAPESQEFSAPP
jgi:type VI secretion system secreted protein VgrG